MAFDLNDNDIINELLNFGVGSKSEIIFAMKKVKNKKDINEIADYILNNKNVCYELIKYI